MRRRHPHLAFSRSKINEVFKTKSCLLDPTQKLPQISAPNGVISGCMKNRVSMVGGQRRMRHYPTEVQSIGFLKKPVIQVKRFSFDLFKEHRMAFDQLDIGTASRLSQICNR